MNDIATQAWDKATTHVSENPLPSDNNRHELQERTAFHALLTVLGDKLDKAETDALIAIWVKATSAERDRGWEIGWESAKNAYRGEVAA